MQLPFENDMNASLARLKKTSLNSNINEQIPQG